MTTQGPKRLTDIAVQNLKPKATRYEVPDGGQRALKSKMPFFVGGEYCFKPNQISPSRG